MAIRDAQSPGVPYAVEVVTITATNVGTLTASKYDSQTATLPAGTRATVTCETANNGRFYVDGSTPTASNGHKVTDGSKVSLQSYKELQNFKAIANTTTLTLQVSYYRDHD